MLNAGWSSGVVGVEQFFFVSGMGDSVCVISHHSCTKCVPPSSPPGGGRASSARHQDRIPFVRSGLGLVVQMCCERFAFGAVALATSAAKLPFSLNVSAKNIHVIKP